MKRTDPRQGAHRVLILADRLEVAVPTARALARAGNVVGVVSAGPDALSVSRCVSTVHRLASDLPESTWEAAARSVLSTGQYDVVLATSDVGVARLTRAQFDVPVAPALGPVAASLVDKGHWPSLCAALGMDSPRSQVVAGGSDPASFAAFGLPVVVKATQPAVVTSGGVTSSRGASVADDLDAAQSAVARLRLSGATPLLQEYLTGTKLQVVILRRGGVTSCRFVAAVERELHGKGGAEVTLRQISSTAGPGAAAVVVLQRLVDAVGYEGLLQSEFMLTPNGRMCPIDINPRLWGGMSFAEDVGLRISERVVRDCLQLPPWPLPKEVPGGRYHFTWRLLQHVISDPGELRRMRVERGRHNLLQLPDLRDPRPELWRSAALIRRQMSRR